MESEHVTRHGMSLPSSDDFLQVVIKGKSQASGVGGRREVGEEGGDR
jgi:hypothetical protein